MPQDKDLKRLVRARMAETGERYTTALGAVDTRERPDERLVQLVAMLGDRATLYTAMPQLKALPPDVLRPLAVRGCGDDNWRIRRACCQLLDDVDFSADSFAALQRCATDDPEPRVRRAAVHSLGCQHCKPEGCVVDLRAVIEKGLRDPKMDVRKMVVYPLTYQWPDAEWKVEILERVVASDPSPNLRAIAQRGLDNIAWMRALDEERQLLPSELRIKTERHRGKFVAISEGLIIDAGGHPGAMERTARKHGHDDVKTYWVMP